MVGAFFGSSSISGEGKGGRGTRPPVPQHRINVGDRPYSYRGLLYSQSAMALKNRRDPWPLRIKWSVVLIEILPLIGDEPCGGQRSVVAT